MIDKQSFLRRIITVIHMNHNRKKGKLIQETYKGHAKNHSSITLYEICGSYNNISQI